MKKAVAPILASRDDSKILDTWSGLDAIALGVKSSEKGPIAVVSEVSKSVVARFDVNLATEISLWPDFTGKPGEIIELPVGAADGIARLYLVGVGAESLEDLRKAGASLGRKTKGTGFHILDALVTKKENVAAHATALALSQYVWSLKSETKKKKAYVENLIVFGSAPVGAHWMSQ